jgi:hypothetical protein
MLVAPFAWAPKIVEVILVMVDAKLLVVETSDAELTYLAEPRPITVEKRDAELINPPTPRPPVVLARAACRSAVLA